MFVPLALRVGRERSAAIRAFSPIDPEPTQILKHCLDKIGTATLGIKIFVSEDENSAPLAGSLGSRPESSSMPNVKKSGGRGRKAAAIG